MATPVDPWRTLGLPPGSSADEVRRAYRALAKANHPDAAGEGALPRFLAIQAAYEQLVGARARRRPGARPSGGATSDAGREPWRADPERARASGRADRRRPGARPGGGPAGGSPGTARPGTRTSGEAGSRGAAEEGGTSGRRARPADGSSGGTSEGATTGAGSSQEPRSRRGGRSRSRKKATPYSTSYDAADDEPFEPGWSGATWYGASSGTYWTINPKEYADPRKHGPEYQRRARRSGAARGVDDDPGADAEDLSEPRSGSTAGVGSSRGESWSRPAAGRSWADVERPDRGPAPAGGSAEPPVPPVAEDRAVAAEPPAIDRLPRFRAPRSLAGRILAAVVAWPFLGGMLAFSIQEQSGCGRFAASCPELSAPGTWLLHAAILVLLVAVPRLAAWLVTGTVAGFVAGAATAVALSAGGGTSLPDVSTTVLGSVVIAAYVGGVLYAIVVERLGSRARHVP